LTTRSTSDGYLEHEVVKIIRRLSTGDLTPAEAAHHLRKEASALAGDGASPTMVATTRDLANKIQTGT
jgi:hypothetical protein